MEPDLRAGFRKRFRFLFNPSPLGERAPPQSTPSPVAPREAERPDLSHSSRRNVDRKEDGPEPQAVIYLDHNATTPLRPEVFEAMRPFLTER